MLGASEMASRIAGLFGDPDGDWWETGNPELDDLIWQIWLLYSEVQNGGLWQYFYNGSGEGAPLVCGMLTEIGAEDTRSIVEAAISALAVDIAWEDEEKRQEIIFALPQSVRDHLYNLDSQLNRHIDDLPAVLYRHMLKHRDQIHAPPGFWEGSE